MRKLIWQLRLWLAIQHMNFFVRPVMVTAQVKWTDLEERELYEFLSSATGEKLQDLLLAGVQDTDRKAVLIGSPHACGYATGQRQNLALLLTLSAHVPPQVDNSEAGEPQRIPSYRHPLAEPSSEELENS